jgi:ATP-dependent DNA helicase HFM1/MER3
MSKVQPRGGARPSWSLHSGGDESADDEDYDCAEGTIAQRLPFSEDAAAQPNNSMLLRLTPAIYPAEHNAIVQVGEHLSEPWASSFFSFDTFNAVQSACFNPAACTDENMVVSAPTGCGKTVIFELAILRLLSCRRSNQDAKVVFMAPIRALCQEKCADWTARFSKLGIKVVELSGDQVNSDMKEVTSAQIICTTPEKWDSITRRWTEHVYLLGKIQLLLVDEAHNIGENRGAALEAVVCRMKTVAKSAPVIKHGLPAKDLRIIAISATLPNLTCIGEFVNASSENVMAFDGSFRPVPLTVHVVGYPAQSSDFWFEKALEKKVPDVIARYSGGRPSLVFCTSRKSAETTVEILCRSGNASSLHRDPALAAAAMRVSTPSLRDALNRGIAFHHANLPPNERNLVEDLFRARKLNVLCCTSTLAMGVNLPAHLVVIKSTAQWQGKASGYSQMSSSTIFQMMGRAGRPGLDDFGIAVIMTDEANKTRYENMSSGCEIVESNLHEVLAEVLNSEVCNAVIESVEDAAEWLKSTFLFTRLKKNPARYGLSIPLHGDIDAAVTAFLNDKIRASLQDLASVGALALDDDGYAMKACKPGHIMSRTMLQLGTMAKIMAIAPDANINEILFALSSTAEVLQEVRMGQKKYLKDLNRLVRFGLPKSKKLESVDKTYLLLQNVLGQAPMDDVTMQREQIMIGEKAGRVLQGLWCVQCNYRSCGLSFASPVTSPFLLLFLANNFIVLPQRPHGGRPGRPCCPLVGDLAS